MILLTVITGCKTPAEVKNTGDLVVRYSQRLNEELQSFEKSLEAQKAKRKQRITYWTGRAESNEVYVNTIKRQWTVSEDKIAKHLFNSVRESRSKPSRLKLKAPEADSALKQNNKEKVYDPEPMETTIKLVGDLTKEESLKEQVEFTFGFAKEVWSQVKEKQNEAKTQFNNGAMEAVKTEAKSYNKMESSVK